MADCRLVTFRLLLLQKLCLLFHALEFDFDVFSHFSNHDCHSFVAVIVVLCHLNSHKAVFNVSGIVAIVFWACLIQRSVIGIGMIFDIELVYVLLGPKLTSN